MGSKSFLTRCKPVVGLFLVSALVLGFLLQNALMVQEVSAAYYSSYDDCISKSGGRGGIPSVQWACSNRINKTDGITNWCTAWLGSSWNSTDNGTTIDVDSTSGSIQLNVWGMCTDKARSTSGIYVRYDNGSISGVHDFERSTWGSPSGYPIWMNVAQFISGVDPQVDGEYLIYRRNIEIWRKNASGSDVEGDQQNSPLAIRIRAAKYASSSIGGTETPLVSTSSGSIDRSENYWLRPRQTTTVSFRHYVYSNARPSINWTVSRSGFSSNSNYTISPIPSSSSSGWAGLGWGRNGYYYSNVSASLYSATFYKVGSFGPFCERLAISGAYLTRVCSNVYVPYNFTNTATVDISGDVVYAGEKTNLKNFSITTNPTYNNTVRSTYATVSPNTRTKIITYVSGSNDTRGYQVISGTDPNLCSGFSYQNGHCSTTNSTSSQAVNSSNNINGQTVSPNINQTYNVYDTKAGNYFCVAAAVYPYTSGSSTNYSNANGSNSWYVSKPACRRVAKRPSFEVWGGSFYSNGNVKTGDSTKNNLEGVDGYGYSSTGGNIRAYGSWIESGIFSAGTITGLASGAATGSTSDGIGGSKEGTAANYCKYRTPLSFSNYSNIGTLCPNTEATGQIGSAGAKLDKNSLVEYIARGTTTNTDGNNIDINSKSNYTETTNENNVDARYTYKDGDISLRGTTIEKDVTHVVRASGTITINGNITYADESYKTLDEIPKLILYAENINITCGVTRLDAIIIANKTVNTCSDSNDINSRANSNQLRINGVIIADKLELRRTYGAATGTNSGEPAEIINYDTSIILWSNAMTDTGSSNVMTATYQRELAPRY